MKNTTQSKNQKTKSGFRILLIIALLLNLFYLLGQTMALINYNFTVSIGLQEPESEITAVGVALNKGFGFGDTFFYIPLFIIGIIGLLRRSKFGLYAMMGSMAITVYWPMVSLSTLFFAKKAAGFSFSDYTSYSIILSLIAIYGLWGFYYLYKNSSSLVKS